MEEAYTSIEWRLLELIASMSTFGLAMEQSGTATYFAEQIANTLYPFRLQALLAAFAVITIILTQPMSNVAAALVVLPIAISTAHIIQVDPRPLCDDGHFISLFIIYHTIGICKPAGL